MEKTAISLFKDGKSSELEKFMKSIKTDEVIAICILYVVLCFFAGIIFLCMKVFTKTCFGDVL